jgi:hypothetical protein
MVYSGMALDGWIALGRETGSIKDVLTIMWAYCLEEPDALEWVGAIVTGKITERAALAALKNDKYTSYLLAKIDWLSLNASGK